MEKIKFAKFYEQEIDYCSIIVLPILFGNTYISLVHQTDADCWVVEFLKKDDVNKSDKWHIYLSEKAQFCHEFNSIEEGVMGIIKLYGENNFTKKCFSCFIEDLDLIRFEEEQRVLEKKKELQNNLKIGKNKSYKI